LCCGSENWIINKGDSQKLKAAQMRSLRPLLGPTRVDCQRNPDVRNRLKVNNIVEDKTLSKEMVRPPGTNGKKPPTEAGFTVPILGTAVYGKTKTKMERPRTP
jgi:hypothetical protein